MWASIRFCFLVSLIFLVARDARALDPHKRISQYGHTSWRERDGFVDHPIAVTQTVDGYIFIGMGAGLTRFDGVRFTPWVAAPGQSLPARGFSSLLGARDGSLWVGTPSGLSRIENGIVYDYASQVGGAGIGSIIEDSAGTIWFTRYRITDGRGPLCKVEGNEVKCYGKEDGIPVTYGLGLTKDKAGNFWFGSDGLCRWAPGSCTVYFQDELKHMGGEGVIDVAAGPSGSVWATLDGIGPNLGVRYYSDGKWSSYVVPGLDGSTIRSHTLLMDRGGSLWIGTESHGLYHIRDGVADHFGIEDGLSGKSVASMYEDHEGNIWVLTDGGVDFFRDPPIVTFSTIEGISSSNIRSIVARTDGTLWIGNRGSLDILRGSDITTISALRGLPGQDIEAMLEDHTGRMWLGIDDRLMTYEHGRFLEVKKLDGRPLGNIGFVYAIAEAPDGTIWALVNDNNHRSLIQMKDQVLARKIPIDSELPRSAKYLAVDRQGAIWIASSSGKLVRYNGEKFEPVRLEADETSLTTHSLFVDSDDALWVSTTKGVYRYFDGKVTLLDPRNGLPCSSVMAVMSDTNGSLWLYSRCGLIRIAASDLAQWRINPDARVPFKIFDVFDGAHPSTGMNLQPRAARSLDGRLWFATDAIVQSIDPARDYTNRIEPPVRIEALFADHKSYGTQGLVNLPPLSAELEIEYTALSLVVPGKVNFRYRLEGHDTEWQEAGPRREAFYNNLGPGKYTFRVIACNNDGIWNESGDTLEFRIAPTWYQATSFRILGLILVGFIIWILYRLRIRQISRALSARFDERLAERTRMARELHDTFIQTVQGSKMVADDALEDSSDPLRMRRAMEQLSTWLGQAIQEGRAALNSLRTSATQRNDLADGLQRATENSLIPDSMTVKFSVEGDPVDMHPIVRDEVYRIGYEAIRNASVHSSANRLEVNLKYAGDLTLRVSDNGIGIDPTISENGREGHFGLQGMRERAARIGARFTLLSSPSSGTEIILFVPAGIVNKKGGSPQN